MTTIGELLGAPHMTPTMRDGEPGDPLATLRMQRPQPFELKDWQKVLGVIGDALRGVGGGAPAFAPYVMGMRQAEQERLQREQEAGMRQQRGREDFLFEEQWKRDHPKPVNNDTINDFNWYSGLNDEQRATYREMHPLYRQGPDGQFYPIAPPPTKPVGKLTPLGDTSTPSGSPLPAPQAAPQQTTPQAPSYQAFDRLIELYGPEEGTRRYLKLIGGG